jgi:hypothetical protein
VISVISHPADDHTIAVLEQLVNRGHEIALVDTGRFPRDASVTLDFTCNAPIFEYATDGNVLNLERSRVAWWRRPRPYSMSPALAATAVAFAHSECHEALAGLWASLNATWVNPPILDEAAHHKPYQLAVAVELGIRVPRTLVTTNPVAARKFVDELGAERTIYKTFLATENEWRETRLLRAEELPLLDRVRLAPVIFQEYIPAVADLRVTVVGSELFAAAITPAPGAYRYDYRMDMSGAEFTPTNIGADTERRLRMLMTRLGLVYGAIDLRRMSNGVEVFLEVNPAGEWLFVEERTRQPITEAMARLLCRLDT